MFVYYILDIKYNFLTTNIFTVFWILKNKDFLCFLRKWVGFVKIPLSVSKENLTNSTYAKGILNYPDYSQRNFDKSRPLS